MKIKLALRNEVLVEGVVRKRGESFEVSDELGETLILTGKFEKTSESKKRKKEVEEITNKGDENNDTGIE